jgi:hypothetical protein
VFPVHWSYEIGILVIGTGGLDAPTRKNSNFSSRKHEFRFGNGNHGQSYNVEIKSHGRDILDRWHTSPEVRKPARFSSFRKTRIGIVDNYVLQV